MLSVGGIPATDPWDNGVTTFPELMPSELILM